MHGDEAAVELARECLYRFLSRVLSDPYQPRWEELVVDRVNQQTAGVAASLLRSEAEAAHGPLAPGERPAEFLEPGPLLAALGQPLEQMRAEYDRVFGLVTPRQCPPYEMEYHPNSEAFFRAQQLADVAGFYRAFGVSPSPDRPERPDHVSLELEFLALLLMKKRLAATASHSSSSEDVQVCDAAQRRFLVDHLIWWLPAFSAGLHRKAGAGLYAAVAGMLAALIAYERQRSGIAPGKAVGPQLIEPPDQQGQCAACPLQI